MKILFLINRLTLECIPMGVMQLSAIAKKMGHLTKLLQLHQDFLGYIRNQKPDLIAISMMSNELKQYKVAIRNIRNITPKIPIIVGGPHPTFIPDVLEDMDIDAICLGEGDQAFKEILERLEAGKSIDGIDNIQTKSYKTKLRPLLENLDQLPFIDRELVHDSFPVLKHFPMREFYTSRGCPYRCTYCFNHAYNKMYRGKGRVVRKRSVENLIQEIEEVISNYHTTFVKFSDDSFAHRADDWLKKFSELYPQKINLPFYCLVRPDCVSSEILYLLKKAGCHSIGMSIETAIQRIRMDILKRNVTNEQILRAFHLCREFNIKTYTNSMLALPSSTVQDDFTTLDFCINCKPDYGNFSIFLPFPHMEVTQYCIDNGFLEPGLTYENINVSTFDSSMLTNYSKKEKNIHKNLVFLGPLAVKIPILKNLILRLTHFPTNRLFNLFHLIMRIYSFNKHIVPIKFSLKQKLMFFHAMVSFELARSRGFQFQKKSTIDIDSSMNQ